MQGLQPSWLQATVSDRRCLQCVSKLLQHIDVVLTGKKRKAVAAAAEKNNSGAVVKTAKGQRASPATEKKGRKGSARKRQQQEATASDEGAEEEEAAEVSASPHKRHVLFTQSSHHRSRDLSGGQWSPHRGGSKSQVQHCNCNDAVGHCNCNVAPGFWSHP